MKFVIFLLLHCIIFCDNAPAASIGKEKKVMPGSWFAEITNSSRLRVLAAKIAARSIQPNEVREYIEKGGTIQLSKYYGGFIDRIFNEDERLPILNFFIFEYNGSNIRSAAPQRIFSMELLLQAGSDPNQNSPLEALSGISSYSPVMCAAITDDLEALKILFKFGGKIDLTENTYTDIIGPPITLVGTEETARFLISKGASINQTDDVGRTALHIAVKSSIPFNEKKMTYIKWLLKMKLLPTQKDRNSKSSLDYIRDYKELQKMRIGDSQKEYRERIADIKSHRSIGGDSIAIETLKNEMEKFKRELLKDIEDLSILEKLLLTFK